MVLEWDPSPDWAVMGSGWLADDPGRLSQERGGRARVCRSPHLNGRENPRIPPAHIAHCSGGGGETEALFPSPTARP